MRTFSRIPAPDRKVPSVQTRPENAYLQPKSAAGNHPHQHIPEHQVQANRINHRFGSISLHRSAEPMQEKSAGTQVGDVLRAPGTALEPGTRRQMERSFGHNFGHIRVHTGGAAARSAEELGAEAWTFNNHIAFRNGMYAPQTPKGRWLLAHELTHTLQQQPSASAAEPYGISRAGGIHEKEADNAATAVMAGAGPQSFSPLAAPVVQRSILGSIWSGFLDVVLFIPRLFGLETFPARDLRNYLNGLKERKGPQRSLFSDNMARACVSREQELGPYDTQTKTWLIEDMLDGYTSFMDEGAIISLLRRSASEQQQIVAAIGRNRLWSNFSGKNRRIIEAITLTAADAGEPLVSRLRNLPSDEIQEYAANATDPAVRESVRRALALSRITAPVPSGAAVSAAGVASFTINGVAVTVEPDRINPSVGNHAFTHAQFDYIHLRPVEITPEIANSPVGPIAPIRLSVKIWSEFASEEAKRMKPGYGVGTRPQDEPTLQFHERAHGEAWLNFLRNNPPPVFSGQASMLPAQYNAAVAQYNSAIDRYKDNVMRYAQVTADCVGTLPTDEQLEGTGFTAAICH